MHVCVFTAASSSSHDPRVGVVKRCYVQEAISDIATARRLDESFWEEHAPKVHCVIRSPNEPIKVKR